MFYLLICWVFIIGTIEIEPVFINERSQVNFDSKINE